jgi:serine/threonine protein kinase/tetratricopeptide (TPR) repeat protein
MMQAVEANYEVIRLLGEGGIGRVYEAVHHPSGRVVAIKTLRSEHGGPTSQRLLLNEAAAAAQIAHPSIVELLDVGRDSSGAMFLVMELVRGASLDAWATAFPGSRAVLRATCEILDALATAHSQGIIHGDLKPANVLLTVDRRVKVTDFGIAHIIDPLRASVTRRGVQGTPYYMAPEQLVDLDSIGPPTDLYALGVILYELLGAREPYPANGTLVDMLARKMHQIKPLEPRPGIAVPRALLDIVMSLLEPDPRVRPRFAAGLRRTLLGMLETLQDEHAVPVPPSSAAYTSAPTITSSDALVAVKSPETSSRSLPFTLPCAESMTDVALHRLRPIPMLGRSDQTDKLLRLVNEGQSRTRGLVVAGRPGEGKTRLLRHGFAEVERTGTMLGAAASFDETIANAEVGLRACIRRLLGAPLPTFDETLRMRWRWLTMVPQPGIDFERIHEWLSPGSRPLDLEATARIAALSVLAASRVHPVYLWLDDVAWSRDGAMELMLRLLERNEARALVVGTLRSGTAEHPAIRDWLLRTAKAGAELVMLPPLTEEDRVALLRAAGPLKQDIALAMGKKLDEPPLVLVETVRTWIEGNWLVAVPSTGEYTVRAGVALDDLIAHATESVLAGRISRLLDAFGSERAQAERVLCHAALLGLRFEERALRRCVDVSAWVDGVLDRALLTGLLRVDGRGAYRFEHRLFLDVIVERCSKRPDAAEIFRTTADALVQTYGKYNTDNGLALAMLYRAGGADEEAVRIAVEIIRGLSRASLFEAADRAIGLAASWVEDLPPNHLHRALVERARGVRYYFSLEYPKARKHLNAARATFTALGATDDLHATLFDLSSTHFYQDHFAEAERYVQYVKQENPQAWARARAHHRLAELCALRFDLDGAIRHQAAAIEVEKTTSNHHYVAVGNGSLAELLIACGRVEEAASAVRAMMQIAQEVGDRHLTSDAERTAAVLDAARGYYTTARGRLEQRTAQLVARGDRWHLTADRAIVAMCAAAQGEPDVETAVHDFIHAYNNVPHDEASTWWAIRSTQAFLRGHGQGALADELGRVLDDRLERIAAAFADDEPITEDEEIRSDAAKRASTQ